MHALESFALIAKIAVISAICDVVVWYRGKGTVYSFHGRTLETDDFAPEII